MKKERQEPVFLLEMPHALRHMIMRRGLMLRSSRARTLCCMNKGGPKAWLEAKLIPTAGESAEENWDKAHAVAAKFKRELHADVYVEPACEFGRFKEMTTPDLPGEFEGGSDSFTAGSEGNPFGSLPGLGSGMNAGGHEPFGHGAGNSNHRSGSNPFGTGVAGMHMPGMPQMPDPMRDIVPPQVRQLMARGKSKAGGDRASKRPELAFPALMELPGWSDLTENKQKMFEVEAAQLHQSGLHSVDESGLRLAPPLAIADILTEKSLAALTVNPKVSASLKRFLLEAFERLTPSQNAE